MNMPLANWITISQQLVIKFGGWFKLYNFALVGTGARLLALAISRPMNFLEKIMRNPVDLYSLK